MMAADLNRLNLETDGAVYAPAILDKAALTAVLEPFSRPMDRPGRRLAGLKADFLAGDGPVGVLAAQWLGPATRPVRAVLFDKGPGNNWSLGWHQDRTIVVRERVEAAGFGPWTRKAGLLHVAPPWEVLSQMLTLRLHLDCVGADNAPLRIAPGTHRLGPIAAAQAEAIALAAGPLECLAQAGDVWVYATPILHASDAARTPARRRVLQVDYAGIDLPGGLRWLGLD